MATLRACSIDPILSQYAERYFYANVTIRDTGAIDTDGDTDYLCISSVAKLLSDRPHIAHYVRALIIVLTQVPESSLGLEILPKLSSLENIVLVLDTSNPTLSWKTFPESFRVAFIDCLQSPSIRKVSLASLVNFPLSALESCEALKSLVLWNSATESSSYHAVSHLANPTIQSLTLGGCEKLQAKLVSWAEHHVPNLRSLVFSTTAGDGLSVLPSIFSTWSNSLTRLHLEFHSRFQTIYDLPEGVITPSKVDIPFSLSSLPYLKQLTIDANMDLECSLWSRIPLLRHYIQIKHSSSLPAICQLLRSAPPSLTHPTLRFHIAVPSYGLFSLSKIDWHPIVELFDSSSCLIRQINLLIYISECGTGSGFLPDQFLLPISASPDIIKLLKQDKLIIKPLRSWAIDLN